MKEPSKIDFVIFVIGAVIILSIFAQGWINYDPCTSYDTVTTDGGFTIHICRTGSMCDLIFENYTAITPQSISHIDVGDVILFKKLTSLEGIAHRVITIDYENNQITTQGDCNSIADSPIPFENVAYILEEPQ